VVPMATGMLSGTKMIVPTLIVGGLAMLAKRKMELESEKTAISEEV
jgi:hypothetical protein